MQKKIALSQQNHLNPAPKPHTCFVCRNLTFFIDSKCPFDKTLPSTSMTIHENIPLSPRLTNLTLTSTSPETLPPIKKGESIRQYETGRNISDPIFSRSTPETYSRDEEHDHKYALAERRERDRVPKSRIDFPRRKERRDRSCYREREERSKDRQENSRELRRGGGERREERNAIDGQSENMVRETFKISIEEGKVMTMYAMTTKKKK